MNNISFVEKIKKNFYYLESEFNFLITFSKNSDMRPETDGIVKFETNTTIVLIDSETGYVTVRFARVVDGEKYYLTPVDIYEYLNTSEQEKKLLLSIDPNDQLAASALFSERFLLNQPGWKGNKGSVHDLEKALNNFSSWLKEHSSICLIGDFSRWPKFYEYKILRTRADFLRKGNDELNYARVKGADGNSKLIKQSMFKDKLDHIEKLKREILG